MDSESKGPKGCSPAFPSGLHSQGGNWAGVGGYMTVSGLEGKVIISVIALRYPMESETPALAGAESQ